MGLKYKEQLKNFFNFELDKKFNVSIINNEFDLVKTDVMEYIYSIINIPIEYFVTYINDNCDCEAIMAADVFQFSSINDATHNICSIIKSIGNPGLKFKKIGDLLLNDEKNRTDIALNKYGENHIKTAELLGLAFKNDQKYYYLSGLGLLYSDMTTDVQEKLLTRLVLRNKLIIQILILAQNGNLNLEAFLYDLSKSTYVRRKSNVKKIINILEKSNEYEFKDFINNITY